MSIKHTEYGPDGVKLFENEIPAESIALPAIPADPPDPTKRVSVQFWSDGESLEFVAEGDNLRECAETVTSMIVDTPQIWELWNS